MDIRTKLTIVELFKRGYTTERVMNKFPAVTKGTLVAIKANVTRGAYK